MILSKMTTVDDILLPCNQYFSVILSLYEAIATAFVGDIAYIIALVVISTHL
jgi:hypothetical protein